MKITKIRAPFQGELVVGILPTPSPEVAAGWARRLNLFTGRSLSADAMETEQAGRMGRLALAGQMVAPGVVWGLEPSLEPGDALADHYLHLGKGQGVTARGEDVHLDRPLRVALADVAVRDPSDGTTPSFGEMMAGRAGVPRLYVVVLQPVTAELVGEQTGSVVASPQFDPCEHDEDADAFDDTLWVDGLRAMLVPWSAEFPQLPVDSERWRNEIAWTVFRAERGLDPGELAPWEFDGVPVGVLALSADLAEPQFIDRYAMTRPGGHPKRRTRNLPAAFVYPRNPFLAQARIQQFADELAHVVEELDPIDDFVPVRKRFRYLPPVGVLPKGILDFAERTNTFFPHTYRVEVLPAPLEQVESVVRASGDLAPFDLAVPDHVRVLVGVPQELYEPELLLTEEVDPEFEDHIAELEGLVGVHLLRRQTVRGRLSTILEAIAGTAPTWPDPDPDAFGEETVARGPLDPEEEDFGTDGAEAVPIRELRSELGAASWSKNWIASEWRHLESDGLEGFIDYLEGKIRRAEDRIDLGFLRVQTDIYRIRQGILGTTEAAKLATSPALAKIVATEASAKATAGQLVDYLAKIRASAEIVPEDDGVEEVVTGAVGTVISPELMMLEAIPSTLPEESPAENENLALSPEALFGGSVSAVGFRAMLENTVDPTSLEPGATESGTLEGAGSHRVAGGPSELAARAAEEVRMEAGHRLGMPSSTEEVRYSESLVGAIPEFHHVTVAKRIEESESVMAKGAAVAGRYEITKGIFDIGLSFDPDTEFPGLAEDDGILKFRDYDESLLGSLAKGDFDLNVDDDSTEFGFFNTSVRAVDRSVATLRIFEAQVQAYRRAIAVCKKKLASLRRHRASADRRLKAIADELAEARHDLGVTTALLAEEEARVAAINARRQRILAEEVDVVLFHRPRFWSDAEPLEIEHELDPGNAEQPVPACIRGDIETPRPLARMVELLREAPASWFVHAPKLLERIPRLPDLRRLIELGMHRAAWTLPLLQEPEPVPTNNRFVLAMAESYARHTNAIMNLRSQMAAFDVSTIRGHTWRKTRETAAKVLSLGDLIEGKHGQTAVAQAAAEELDNIRKVATCLYDATSEILPIVRLGWAERLSEHDDPVRLTNLASLPRWSEIEDNLQREELQTFVDWLNQRVDRRLPEAADLMGDVIRVAILLASEAPVGQILTGRLPRPAPLEPGSIVDVLPKVLGAVHIGMAVKMLRGAEVIATGVVHDIGDGEAAVRVQDAIDASATAGLDTLIQFAEPRVMGAPVLAPKGLMAVADEGLLWGGGL